MDVKFKDKEFKICPALAVMTCHLVSFCDLFKCEIQVMEADESSFKINTENWSETLIHKYSHVVCRDYSDLGLVSLPLCNIMGNSIKIIVNPNMKIDKFNKG